MLIRALKMLLGPPSLWECLFVPCKLNICPEKSEQSSLLPHRSLKVPPEAMKSSLGNVDRDYRAESSSRSSNVSSSTSPERG